MKPAFLVLALAAIVVVVVGRAQRPKVDAARAERGSGAISTRTASATSTGDTAPPRPPIQPPSVIGQTPSASERTPSVDGQTPSLAGQTPSVDEETPSASGQTPDPRGQTPSVGGETPSTSGQTPSVSGQTPSTSGQTPSLAGQTPSIDEETPSASGQTPDPRGQTPSVGVEDTDLAARTPGVEPPQPLGGESLLQPELRDDLRGMEARASDHQDPEALRERADLDRSALLAQTSAELERLQRLIGQGQQDVTHDLILVRNALATAAFGLPAPPSEQQLAHLGQADQSVLTAIDMLYDRNSLLASQLLMTARHELNRVTDPAPGPSKPEP